MWIKPRVMIGIDQSNPEFLMGWAVDSADAASWFSAYGDQAERLCREARAVGVTAVLDGNALVAMTRRPEQASRWNALHDRLRSALGGLVSRNINGFQPGGPSQVDDAPLSYFDRLDFVGLSSYPPLTRGPTPSRAQRMAG